MYLEKKELEPLVTAKSTQAETKDDQEQVDEETKPETIHRTSQCMANECVRLVHGSQRQRTGVDRQPKHTVQVRLKL